MSQGSNSEAKWLTAWYGKKRWVYTLLPLEGLFRLLSYVRRIITVRWLQKNIGLPVIVVGNISVGGTGKTPLIIALVNRLQKRGLKVGVISRGYGSAAPQYPYVVSESSSATEAGDEPLSIWRATGCAVCIDADRVAAARILKNAGCDVLLSDDGLQHYRLGRTLEIAVIDAARGFGNGHCLPVGPLREPRSRLKGVDFVVVNQTSLESDIVYKRDYYNMRLQPQHWFKVKDLTHLPLDHLLAGTHVHAVAGIGNPNRFFSTLGKLGLTPECHIYRDHHTFTRENFQFRQVLPVVMTSKDAVKCQTFAEPEWLALEVEAVLEKRFWPAFEHALEALFPYE
ncbi:tetraacyldisaccharide 4'-kinase [Gilvimarinus polysaccharolyticus]|uniref:tetraacyldisaccharide 4'-kinase n=1 Tax=Gilvimarinus polysaccharolyticus TaxID=863921 RepID=UPI00067319D0|nr:tetraacyldisaccharide 4'-kinase [Gilvimarinus polysaccharolyticus]